jgi:hypothetical protein
MRQDGSWLARRAYASRKKQTQSACSDVLRDKTIDDYAKLRALSHYQIEHVTNLLAC